ncbi:hypothetical protein QWZ14_00005, partial [Paeniroseomonas aquatica]
MTRIDADAAPPQRDLSSCAHVSAARRSARLALVAVLLAGLSFAPQAAAARASGQAAEAGQRRAVPAAQARRSRPAPVARPPA